ncbi:MAG: STAS domain-containing protein [Thiohalocapsa sp.]|jgi:ABC-type transporter Mla MlaB component
MTQAGPAAAAQLTHAGADRWRLDGDLTLAVVATLAATPPTAGTGARVHLDLAGIHRPSSAGVALLLEWQAQLREQGLTLVLHNTPAAMRRLAMLANVQALLGLGDSTQPTATASRAADGS